MMAARRPPTLPLPYLTRWKALASCSSVQAPRHWGACGLRGARGSCDRTQCKLSALQRHRWFSS